jgi:hypothetical protein
MIKRINRAGGYPQFYSAEINASFQRCDCPPFYKFL